MIYKAIYSICFSLTFLAPAAAQALTLCGKSAQGEVLNGLRSRSRQSGTEREIISGYP